MNRFLGLVDSLHSCICSAVPDKDQNSPNTGKVQSNNQKKQNVAGKNIFKFQCCLCSVSKPPSCIVCCCLCSVSKPSSCTAFCCLCSVSKPSSCLCSVSKPSSCLCSVSKPSSCLCSVSKPSSCQCSVSKQVVQHAAVFAQSANLQVE